MTFSIDHPEDQSTWHTIPVASDGRELWQTAFATVGKHQVYVTYWGDFFFAPTWVLVPTSTTGASGALAPLAATSQDTYSPWIELTHVVTWPFDGFFAPVDNNMLNVAKAGSAIPVKFSLGGDQGLDTFAAGYPKAVRISCDTGESADAVEEYTAASTSGLKYDARLRPLPVQLEDDQGRDRLLPARARSHGRVGPHRGLPAQVEPLAGSAGYPSGARSSRPTATRPPPLALRARAVAVPRIHTSCAVVVAPTFVRAFARWCFTFECDRPRRWAAAFSDPATRSAATTPTSRPVARSADRDDRRVTRCGASRRARAARRGAL